MGTIGVVRTANSRGGMLQTTLGWDVYVCNFWSKARFEQYLDG